jgi:hypothetical protein
MLFRTEEIHLHSVEPPGCLTPLWQRHVHMTYDGVRLHAEDLVIEETHRHGIAAVETANIQFDFLTGE